MGKALVSTFEAAKIQTPFNDDTEEYHQIFDLASKDLDTAARCLKFSGEDDIQWSEEELIMKNCLLLACDWQLNARTKFWQSKLAGGPVTSNYLQSFQHDLNSLKRVSESLTVRWCIFLLLFKIGWHHLFKIINAETFLFSRRIKNLKNQLFINSLYLVR